MLGSFRLFRQCSGDSLSLLGRLQELGLRSLATTAASLESAVEHQQEQQQQQKKRRRNLMTQRERRQADLEQQRVEVPPWDATYPPDLEMLRRHNSSLPELRGQVIKGRVVKVDRHVVHVDTGLRAINRFYKNELSTTHVVEAAGGGAPPKVGKSEFEVGDVLHFVVEDLEDPFGEMTVNVDKPHAASQLSEVWKELEEKMAAGEAVQGRVLNEVNGGFAVGVAGHVAFCPFSLMSPVTAKRMGVLQPFLVQSMKRLDEAINPRRGAFQVVVIDTRLAKSKMVQQRLRTLEQQMGGNAAPAVQIARVLGPRHTQR